MSKQLRRAQHLAAQRGGRVVDDTADIIPNAMRAFPGLPLLGRKRSPFERRVHEVDDRLYKRQVPWFTFHPAARNRVDWRSRSDAFYGREKQLIVAAFDVPETIPIVLQDYAIRGYDDMYSTEWLECCIHWLDETRYWRCIGIQRPFYDKATPRAYAWTKQQNTLTWEYEGYGTPLLTAVNLEAIMDMERAVRRKEMGLEPNYIWDEWTPSGFPDGRRHDFLPRNLHNPYVDPDGITVTLDDIADHITTHDKIKERYKDCISVDADRFKGIFLTSTFAGFSFGALSEDMKSFYNSRSTMAATPQDLRCLAYIDALPALKEAVASHDSWAAVANEVIPVVRQLDLMVVAAQIARASRSKDAIRRLIEERCGFKDFMLTPERDITAAVTELVDAMKSVVSDQPWGQKIFTAFTDQQRQAALGSDDAFAVYKTIEGLADGSRRASWATRFTQAPMEEKTLDYMLESLGKRPQATDAQNTTGKSFDREMEPIGRNVQRRVIAADMPEEDR